MNNSNIMGFTGGPKTACIPNCHMVSLPYGNIERSIHDGRGASTTSERAGVEPLQAKAKRERISVRSEVDARRKVSCTSHKTRGAYSGSSAREASQGKIIASEGWQTIYSFGSFRANGSGLENFNHSPTESRATFSIHRPLSYGKVLCSVTWARDR